jgi:pyruvate/2-oxoglutarate dehydrogenase complex dihydrolipoamide dehydrogenase (E3) component
MNYQKDGDRNSAEASLAIVAIGWQANTADLNLAVTGAKIDSRGFILVDPYLQTTAPHIFAAGDVTGRLLLVPPAIQDGFVAATNAIRGPTMALDDAVNPIGSFTDPEYAQVGLTETQGREAHDVVTSTIHFDETTRTIIDGRTFGFCKLIVDRVTHKILGCHVVGERAVEITQVATIVITAGMRIDALAHVPLSFPTYAGILGRVAASVTRQLNQPDDWQAR